MSFKPFEKVIGKYNAHYHREIIQLKVSKILKNTYYLFKVLYLFKIREQTPFFERKVWSFGKCSLNLQRSKYMNTNKTVNKYGQRRRNHQ